MPATRRPARASLPFRVTDEEAAAARRFATAEERHTLRVTLLSMYAAGQITRDALTAAVIALGLPPLRA